MNFLRVTWMVAILGLMKGRIAAQTSELAPDPERTSFENLLSEARRSYGLDTRLSEKWRTWVGITTKAGTDLIIDDLFTSVDQARRELCYFFAEDPRTSKAGLAGAILARSESADLNPWLLSRHITLLSTLNLGDQPEVVPFWAKHLDDTRSVEIVARQRESQLGQTMRVCDMAEGCLTRWLRGKGYVQEGDPELGDPGGETMWKARNAVIDRVNRALMEHKLITTPVRPAENARTPPPPTTPRATILPVETPDPIEQTDPSLAPPIISNETPAIESEVIPPTSEIFDFTLWAGILGAILLAGVGLTLWKSKGRKG